MAERMSLPEQVTRTTLIEAMQMADYYEQNPDMFDISALTISRTGDRQYLISCGRWAINTACAECED